eukprot:CAMPEP_0197453110 /NCGR_PEP_ID=MMETSP1175-20131217/33996_1 /TAXON_ID=1003142 /ORGANISM="Triceratium dubium, Strain CCMP147" /LENGTH=452 /DNA_ID=CAMNT_0042986291 /DNA_START=117 /DNA_END=1475 /DNA_ORIENTATION=+
MDQMQLCYDISPLGRIPHLPPLVIGHRGAAYNLPEHTLESYQLAYELGANYVEPDFVPTKDGRLVAVHSIDLNITTNVASVFQNRSRTIVRHGLPWTGYFSFDFTLDEIKSLRVRQGIEDGSRSEEFDWLFSIPTIQEIASLIYDWNTNTRLRLGRTRPYEAVGMYAELKKPKLIQRVTGMVMEELFVKELQSVPSKVWDMLFPQSICNVNSTIEQAALPPLVVHCFERNPLRSLRTKFLADEEGLFSGRSAPPLVLLLSRVRCSVFRAWNSVHKYADGVNPDMACLLDSTVFNGVGTYKKGTAFMREAHKRNMFVHAWTERAELEYVVDSFPNAKAELTALFCDLGVDGVFAENVDIAVRASNGCGHQKLSAPVHSTKSKKHGSRFGAQVVHIGIFVFAFIVGRWTQRSFWVCCKSEKNESSSECSHLSTGTSSAKSYRSTECGAEASGVS